ncbi:MAG: DNA/RNA nuclease SfsA [Candidatus Zixiibacteriota bacterium]|nr:MAG: DNA/RNA nuclease SfsA [candidate division Zixibacteria bacterium]
MIKFPPLTEALFVERPNRFLVNIKIDGRSEFAHLHDPGRLQELLIPGAKLYLQKTGGPNRKTRWDVILVRKGRIYVAIYSVLANRLAKKLFAERNFPGLRSWKLIRSEPKFKNGRFDFELARRDEKMLVEVKSVSLVENGIAMFPDAPTERGRRHLLKLTEAMAEGYNACVIFIVTRNDARLFKPHTTRDPDFSETLKHAAKQGVKLYCFKCNVSREHMHLSSRIPIQTSRRKYRKHFCMAVCNPQ